MERVAALYTMLSLAVFFILIQRAVSSPPPGVKNDDFFKAAAYIPTWGQGRTSDDGAPSAPPPGVFKAAAYIPTWGQGRTSDDGAPSAPPPEVNGNGRHMPMADTGILFLGSSLFTGAKLPQGTRFAREPIVPSADDVPPFRYEYMDSVLAHFGIAVGSTKAAQVGDTLRFCAGVHAEAANNYDDDVEPQTCAASRRAAAEFAAAALRTHDGEELQPRDLTTLIHGRAEPDRYVVTSITPVADADAVVACHPLAYPYAVYFCHRPRQVEALLVNLVGEEDRGLGATAIAVCHRNTTSWDAAYFEFLGGVRGQAICHYMPDNYVLYVAP